MGKNETAVENNLREQDNFIYNLIKYFSRAQRGGNHSVVSSN